MAALVRPLRIAATSLGRVASSSAASVDPSSAKLTILSNGMRVISQDFENTWCSLGCKFIGVVAVVHTSVILPFGARYENPSTTGHSYFIDKLAYKVCCLSSSECQQLILTEYQNQTEYEVDEGHRVSRWKFRHES
jgi:hypothetical protein